MSLDKAIQHKKEYRKPYRGAASWDSHCRNNNACSYCRDNRLYSSARELLRVRDEMRRWEDDQGHWTWDGDEVPD